MTQPRCRHCGGPTPVANQPCAACQAELQHLDTDQQGKSRRKFILSFVAIALFCAVMVLFLPR